MGSRRKGCQALTQMLPGRVTPALWGRGGCFLRLLARQAAGPLGPWGDPDVVSFQLRCFPKWEEGDWRGHKEEPRGPLGFTEEQSRRESGDICFPGCRLQGAKWAGPGLGAPPSSAGVGSEVPW